MPFFFFQAESPILPLQPLSKLMNVILTLYTTKKWVLHSLLHHSFLWAVFRISFVGAFWV